MTYQSNLRSVAAHIELPEDFPVDEPEINERGEKPAILPHIHDVPEIGYCYSGSGLFIVADRIFPFQAGDAFFVNTREVHLAKANVNDRAVCGWLHVDPVRLLAGLPLEEAKCLQEGRYGGARFRNVLSRTEQPELCGNIHAILEEARRKREGWRSMIRSRVWLVMQLLERQLPPAEEGISPQTAASVTYEDLERLRPALQGIDRQLRKEVSVRDLAAKSCLSEASFRRLFHRVLGCSAREYVSRLRLNMAYMLLRNSSTPITEIALRCGFRDISNFNRQFLRCFGCSPRQARHSG